MSPERLNAALAIADLSVSGSGHAISLVVGKIKQALERVYPETKIRAHRISPIVSVKENFDDLLFPADNAGRSSRYTRYVSAEKILRTHTSAGISSWLQKESQNSINDSMVLVPGICYRRDVVDKTHSGELHQMDVWRVKHGNNRLTRKSFIALVENIINALMPGSEYRANEVTHPYTINGLEVEIKIGDSWMEILEGGEIHPTVLQNFGLDPKEYSGLALGMGLDRLVMLIKRIDDIRILRSEDERIKSQMADLKPYNKVSFQPITKRVISFSADISRTEEDICEKIRDGLGEHASCIEKIGYQEVAYELLPEKARFNLGIQSGQKNVIAEIIFRPLEKSLPKELVNEWMQHLYPILNEGQGGYI